MTSRFILLNSEQNKSIHLRDEMFFIQFWLQIKQNGYSKGPFRALVETQFIIKVTKNCKNSHF